MTRRAKSLYFDDYGPMWVDADGELMGSPHDEFDRENFHWANKHPKSKREHPYSYDMQTIWAKDVGVEGNASAYSDRFILWEYDAYKLICSALGEQWKFSDVDKVEKMLQLYFTGGKVCGNIELVRIVEGCNVSNGYPVWLFIWWDLSKGPLPKPKPSKIKHVKERGMFFGY